MKFRKRPIVILATRWFRNGDHPEDAPDAIQAGTKARDYEGRVVRRFRRPDVPGSTHCGQCMSPMDQHGWLDTLEGGHVVCPGDWVITGVKGERYPCKPDIFAATYEVAE
jgi:hypothetical protein